MPFLKRDNTVPVLVPKPIVVNPSGSFEGDDGKWSTFTINIGDNQGTGAGQNFRILPWTSAPAILVPAVADWCDNSCAASRGVEIFNGNQQRGLVQSSSYKPSDLLQVPLPYWWSNDLTSNTSSPGTLNASYGTDYVGLGDSSASSLVLAEPIGIASYTFKDFFFGSLGLAVGQYGPSGATMSPIITAAYDLQLLPSHSYGFTAGAYYRNGGKGVPGNLVLGGYDKSRLTAQGTSFTMPSKQNNSLVVGVESIVVTPNSNVNPNAFSFTSTSGGFSAVIDSALPFLILPDNICDQFQKYFQLQFDTTKMLYTVNSSAHQFNLQQNSTVTFKVGPTVNSNTNFAAITLPYAAFDQQVSFPIANNQTSYFPIKKSQNGEYVLGRTFLQEAYIIVDYERGNFTVAPAVFNEPLPTAQVVTIFNTTYTGLPKVQNSSSGLSAGAIAGIVVGIVLAFLLVGIGAFVWWRKRHNAKKDETPPYEPPPETQTILAGNEVKHRRVSELTGTEVAHSRKPSNGDYYPADRKPIPPISEMSPESTPAELYSPPQGSESDRDSHDYFAAGAMRRKGGGRGRHSSNGNTPGTPIAELPGDSAHDLGVSRGLDTVSPVSAPAHGRGRSDTSLSTNIDEVLGGRQETEPTANAHAHQPTEPSAGAATTSVAAATTSGEPSATAKNEAESAGLSGVEGEHTVERRPSHSRGLSDTTIKSDTTAVSQPSADELEDWARHPELGPDRPLSPPVVVPTRQEENTK